MDIYLVKQITEADYGCEDTGRKTPAALLVLEKEGAEQTEKRIEVPEEKLRQDGITEGKRVCFSGNGEILKYVRVVAAVLRNADKIFATARGYGKYKGWWEFPGGKIEKGETSQQALVREIREELNTEIEVGDLLKTIEYDYPDFHLSMDCFRAAVKSGNLELKEAEAARWLGADELDDVKWLPADEELISLMKQELCKS